MKKKDKIETSIGALGGGGYCVNNDKTYNMLGIEERNDCAEVSKMSRTSGIIYEKLFSVYCILNNDDIIFSPEELEEIKQCLNNVNLVWEKRLFRLF
ncbi:MAG: hypothetical protein KJO12_06750 [Ignavibacteria bacterium]|nr:hypothetical protein [Ignavibacteria bacterium]